MPANDREVFEELIGQSEFPTSINYLTYALFAFERREWIEHKARRNQNISPNAGEIDDWIADLTASQFSQMRDRAVATFDVSAREYMAREFEAAKEEWLQATIVREVKAAGSLWRQLLIALVTAILAPVIIGLILVAAARYEAFAPTILGTKSVVEGGGEPSKAEPKN